MGLSNAHLYRPTQHFLDRVCQRFDVQRGKEMSFFSRESQTLEHIKSEKTKDNKKVERWQNKNSVFIVDPVAMKIITVYSTEYLFAQNKSKKGLTDPLLESTSRVLEKEINNQIFARFLAFVNENEENINNISELMNTMKSTCRPDYRERQIQELETLLTEVSESLLQANQTKEHLERIKEMV